jgi:hypothetical protein
MPTAPESDRARWRHEHDGDPECICETKAHEHLMAAGVKLRNGVYCVPADLDLDSAGRSALRFLILEWDYWWDRT